MVERREHSRNGIRFRITSRACACKTNFFSVCRKSRQQSHWFKAVHLGTIFNSGKLITSHNGNLIGYEKHIQFCIFCYPRHLDPSLNVSATIHPSLGMPPSLMVIISTRCEEHSEVHAPDVAVGHLCYSVYF